MIIDDGAGAPEAETKSDAADAADTEATAETTSSAAAATAAADPEAETKDAAAEAVIAEKAKHPRSGGTPPRAGKSRAKKKCASLRTMRVVL